MVNASTCICTNISNFLVSTTHVFDSITIENGTLNPPCAEGAPLPLWDAGAEIQDRVNQKLSARQWTDPKKTVTKDTPSYQHTGKGPCQTRSERKVFGKFFVDVWGTAPMFSSPMGSILPIVFQPCCSAVGCLLFLQEQQELLKISHVGP